VFGLTKIPSDIHIRDMLDPPRRSCCIRWATCKTPPRGRVNIWPGTRPGV